MKKIFSNQYIFSILTKVLIVFLGILSSVFINRYLGPTLKGEYSYILNIINIAVLVLNLGIYQSYPYFKRKYGEIIKSEYFNVVTVQFAIYMIIAIILSVIISNIQLTVILTLTPLMIYAKQLNFIALVEDINLRNKLNIGNQFFYIILLFIIYSFMPTSIFWVFIALYTKDIFIIARLIHKYKFNIKIKLNNKLLFETIKYGIFPMLSALLITMNYNIDIIILRFFVDFKNIGYYSVGVSLANQVWLIPDAFKDVLFSKTSRSDAIDDIKMSIKVNLYISIFIILSIALLGKPIIQILYGSEYLPAYSITVIIFGGLIPMIFYKMIISLFNARGKQKLSFWILLLSVLINVVMNFILIPLYGNIGAAISSVVSYSVCGVVFTYIFMKEYNIKVCELLLVDKVEFNRIKELIKK